VLIERRPRKVYKSIRKEESRKGALITCLLQGTGDLALTNAAICKAECCDSYTETVVSTPCKMFAFNKLPRAFSMLFIQCGDISGEHFSGQSETTSPAALDATVVLHTGNRTQPRAEFSFSLQLSSHGFIFILLLSSSSSRRHL